MVSDREKEAYLDEMIERRGYVLPYHRVLVDNDLEIMRSMDQLVKTAYTDRRSLSPREKELIFIVSLTVIRASSDHIESHIRKASELGVPFQDILEAIEIALPEAGVVAFQHGVECWLRVRDMVDQGSIESSDR